MFPTRKGLGGTELQDSVIFEENQANLCGQAATY
jgi:hypothetical protein